MSSMQPMSSSAQYSAIVERDEAIAELGRARAGVTVCIPCFNQAEYLPKALASANQQTRDCYEIIVVDDGSDPDQAEEIASLSDDFSATYVHVTNRGLPSARNTGLMLAKTEFFLPLDADDWIEATYIAKTVPLMADADVVVPGLQEHGPTRNGTYMPGYDRPLSEVTVDLMWNGFNRTFYCSLFRTGLLREVGGWNGRMVNGFEDYDLALDLMIRGARYVGCEEVLFHYQTRPDGMLTDAMRRQEEIRAEMKRHHRLP